MTGDPELTGRPTLAVKVDNAGPARPQWSLEYADVIFEENVESLTRFVAMFHSRLPDEIGPVRSARNTDIDILAAANRPVLAWSGGNPGVTALVVAADQAGLLRDGSAMRLGSCYRRSSERRAPHNLLARPDCLLERHRDAGPARPLWQFGAAPASGAVPSPASFEVQMDGVVARWSWDQSEGRYLRDQRGAPHVAASGARIGATNVVVMVVAYRPSAVDARSPEAITVGSGTVVVHREGRSWTGTWSRATSTDPFTFTAADGSALLLAPGTTFVELARSL